LAAEPAAGSRKAACKQKTRGQGRVFAESTTASLPATVNLPLLLAIMGNVFGLRTDDEYNRLERFAVDLLQKQRQGNGFCSSELRRGDQR
jgi:hypothetical protein